LKDQNRHRIWVKAICGLVYRRFKSPLDGDRHSFLHPFRLSLGTCLSEAYPTGSLDSAQRYLASFIGSFYSVISFLLSVIGFYLYVLSPYLLGALLSGIASAFRRLLGPPRYRASRDRPIRPDVALPRSRDHSLERPLEEPRPHVTVSSVIREMDCRSVLLDICFWERFYERRFAIAQVRKPQAGESRPTLTFVLCDPSSLWGETVLVRVPDNQLSDFEEVQKGVYRLTSVLHVDDLEDQL